MSKVTDAEVSAFFECFLSSFSSNTQVNVSIPEGLFMRHEGSAGQYRLMYIGHQRFQEQGLPGQFTASLDIVIPPRSQSIIFLNVVSTNFPRNEKGMNDFNK